MIAIVEKSLCCGCTACYASCPTKSIDMKADSEGFLYPTVNSEECIGCGICDAVCPIMNPLVGVPVQEAYIIQDKREEIRSSSSSGGAFTAITEYIINEKQGVVYGACYDDSYQVIHKGIDSSSQIELFRGSKYVQSNLKNCFEKVKNDLKKGKWVCFSGTPCQIVGLKKYLKCTFKTLLTVDIACHGVPSPLVFQKYLEYWKEKEKSELSTVEFRSKIYGYSGSTMRLIFDNGSQYTQGSMLQFFKNTMFAGLSLRPSCHACQFKEENRVSDFTIFDCWDANVFEKSFDDDLGTTAMLVHSQVGSCIVKEIKQNWKIKGVNSTELIKNDGDMITECAEKNKKRNEFFNDFQRMPLEQLNQKYFPLTLKKKLIYYLKPFLSKVGLLKKLKRRLK